VRTSGKDSDTRDAGSDVVGQTGVTVHVGRQAIYNAAGEVAGYELLFRDSGAADESRIGQGDEAQDAATTSTILAAFTGFDVRDLLGGRLGFVNLTRAFLVGDLPIPFEPGTAALEVLEDVDLDSEVLAGVQALNERGYAIALDDFSLSGTLEPLLDIADIVKIDMLKGDWEQILETIDRCRQHGVRMLAERVEDEETLKRAQDAGFELFQGFHLGRPQTLSADSLAPGRATALQLLGRLADPDTTAREVETLIRVDPALTFRLLRIANSASNGLRRPVSSIRDAVVLVGLARLRSWMILITLSDVAGSSEHLIGALIRARTCETIARLVDGVRPDTAFTAGLLHAIAELLGTSPEHLLEGMPPMAQELQDALRGMDGDLAQLLRAVVSYERQDLAGLKDLEIPMSEISLAYLAALAWTSRTMEAVTG
jgi:c-di-GMP-related signal transduction protein